MATTLQDLQNQLTDLHQKLQAANVGDVQRLQLEILERQIKMELIVGAFDPLKDLDSLGGVDCSKIKALVQQVGQVIQNETERTKMLTQIISMAKTALRATGLPIS